jgi:hypothetical protein
VYVAPGAAVGAVVVAANSFDVTLDGAFAAVEVQGNTNVNLGEAKVEALRIEGESAQVTVSAKAEVAVVSVGAANAAIATETGAKVKEVVVQADGAEIKGTGSVASVKVESGEGVTVTAPGANVTVSESAGAVRTGDGKSIESGTTAKSEASTGSSSAPAAEQPPATSGGGGGGGSSSGGNTVTVDPTADGKADRGAYYIAVSHLADLTFVVVEPKDPAAVTSVTVKTVRGSSVVEIPTTQVNQNQQYRCPIQGNYALSEVLAEIK